MLPASNEKRQEFIETMQGWAISRIEFQASVGKEHGWSTRDIAIYSQGLQMGVDLVIAATDSRELNEAQFRITDTEGNFIPFYADNHPSGHINLGKGKFESLPGLIVSIWDIDLINN
ncbi:hypothetical protein D3C81_1152090 [compost metagenome]